MRKVTVCAIALVAGFSAHAQAQTYVGSFEVDSGPNWGTNPQTYSALDAAALIFGGSPTDYEISTIDSNPANIDFMEWTSTVFVPGGAKNPENYKVGVNYQDPGGTSAYVQDNAVGPAFTNFVFRQNVGGVPEPSSIATMGALFAGGAVCFARRRRKAQR